MPRGISKAKGLKRGRPVGFRKSGRPRVQRVERISIVGSLDKPIVNLQLDVHVLHGLAMVMASQQEMADALGVSRTMWDELTQTNPLVREAIERGFADARVTLRRKQMELAMAGHPGMLIWLGKQYLGQADKVESHETKEVSITVQRAAEQIKGISTERLLAARNMLTAINHKQPEVIEAECEEIEEGHPPV